jgi:cephalosporin-C deacetylase-like acetyl esterase
MMSRIATRIVFVSVIVFGSLACSAQEIVVTPLHANGIYASGEKIEWTIVAKGPNTSALKAVNYVLKKGELTEMKKGVLDLSSGKTTVETSLDEPGTVLLEIRPGGTTAGKPVRVLAGAVVDPEKIGVSAPPPEDFDAFWAAKINELGVVPANPQIEPADGGDPSVDYYKLRMDNIHGSHIYGQLAKPKKEGKFPAMLVVQYAGVYGLPKTNVTKRAEQGWIALNIMAHDLPFDQPEDFYKKAAETTLKDYVAIGDDDRDKSYFLWMYLACYRAVDYLSERPDWDGKTLVVTGTSQGGQQTLITAALCPKITTMLANVPGGCDVTGPKVGRAAGFPYWANRAKASKNEKILETGRYFDVVNFAPRIKCPAMVSMGLIDETCPAAGVLAAFNQIQGSPKEAVIMVNSDHHGTHNAQAEYFKRSERWLAALVKGKPLPDK